MKIRGLTLIFLMHMLILFSKLSYASTDYLEVGVEVANGIVTKAGKVQEEIASTINGFISEKMSKIAGDYMQMKKKLKKVERTKERMEKIKERQERIKERADKFKKRKNILMKKNAKLQEQVEKIQKKYNKAKDAVEKQVAEVQKDVAELKEKADEAKVLIEDSKEIVGDSAEFVKNAHAKIDNAVDMAEEIKMSAENKLNNLNTDISNVRKQAEVSPPVSLGNVNYPVVMPDADNIGELAQETATDVEFVNDIDVDVEALLKTSVSADEIMELSEIDDVEAYGIATEIGQVNIQDQLQNLNKSKAKNKIIKKQIMLEGDVSTDSNRKLFDKVSEKLDSVKATQDLIKEAINE